MTPLKTYPSESDARDGTAQHVGDDRRVRVGGREVRVELGAVPVGHTGHDDALDVGHHVLPALGLLGGLRRD